ncbi:phenylalanine--tRNA ligase subunit beta [Patescibacteria group bacterium]|nr:phenylalanine--tRNA ligase subunit beta [Patescibacteria group bacterium]
MVQKFSYNWLCEYLGEPAPAPSVIADLLTKHAFEVEGIEEHHGDTVIELKILPDRGSDCLCHRGLARELATLLDVPLKHDPLETEVTIKETNEINVSIEDFASCPRFTASIIRGVKVGPSPAWLVAQLQAIGVRSINNIVDATNYAMFALGEPTHAYDAGKFPKTDGAYNFVVRKSNPGETVSLLAEGGKDENRIVTLRGGELLIVDGTTNTAVGLAGVKGGRYAGVDSDTTDIIVEAAHFEPGLTRRTARGLGIVIDASKRFENEPAQTLPPLVQQYLIELITKVAGGECVGMVDVHETIKIPQPVKVNPRTVCALLGVEIPKDEMVTILRRDGVMVVDEGEHLVCTGPHARTDLNIEADFIEEIGRIYGYHHVVSVVPEPVPLTEFNKHHIYAEHIRINLVNQGFTEIITTTFRNQDEIGLQSSMASDKCFIRSELTSSLSDALTRNAPFTDLLGVSDTRLFEIGTVFTRHEGVVAEHISLALGVRLKTTGYSGKEDKILTEALASLAADLGVSLEWNIVDAVAELNLTTLIETLPDVHQYDAVAKLPDVTYQPFSNYPSVTRDIAMWVGEGTDVRTVETLLRAEAGSLLVRLTHLDTFTKDGRTSLAFRLVFQSKEKTLTASEVDDRMSVIHDACAKASFEVR